MRRAWVHRFMGLLWLALCCTAVLPWAHELSHLTGHESRVSTSLPQPSTTPAHEAESAGEALPNAIDLLALSAKPDGGTDATVELCVICLHLGSQHLSPPRAATVSLSIQPQRVPQPTPAMGGLHAPPSWLIPSPRAPPAPSASA